MAEGLSWGDIRLVDLGGSAGKRPGLVLSRQNALPHLNQVTIAPITTQIRNLPSEVRLGVEQGLKGPSVARLDLLQPVLPESLGRFVGSIGPEFKGALRSAVLFSLELDDHGLADDDVSG